MDFIIKVCLLKFAFLFVTVTILGNSVMALHEYPC